MNSASRSLFLSLVFSFSCSARIPTKADMVALFDSAKSEVSKCCWRLFSEQGIAVPMQMRDLENVEIIHLESLRQMHESCAWYSVLNAVAISELFASSRSLNHSFNHSSIKNHIIEALIPRIAEQEDLLKKRLSVELLWQGIGPEAINELARFFNLSHYYKLELEAKENWCCWSTAQLPNELAPYCDPSKYRDYYAIKSPDHFLKKVITVGKPIHFLLGVPADFGGRTKHAVLVTVICTQGHKKLKVIYMDSNNMPLSSNQDFWVLPSALYRFFQALNNAFA